MVGTGAAFEAVPVDVVLLARGALRGGDFGYDEHVAAGGADCGKEEGRESISEEETEEGYFGGGVAYRGAWWWTVVYVGVGGW